MNRLLLTLGFALVAAPFAAIAQDASAEDLARAKDYLTKTRDALVAATDGLTEAQWNFKPAPERWSVAEVVEHLAASEDFLLGMVRDQIMQAPARKEPADLAAVDALVISAITDRTHKAKAPEPLMPTRRFGAPAEALAHFRDSRGQTLAFLAGTKALRGHAADSPLGQPLDAYQWLLFIGAHSERHTKQLLEVKADPRFPQS